MSTLYTYDDASRKEDVSDIIDHLKPQDTQLYTGLTKTKAIATYHETLTDTLETVADNAQNEGADFSSGTSAQPTRVGNFTQIFGKYPQVSRTERSVAQYGMADAYSYQVEKKMEALKNDMEYALMRGSGASGTGSAPRRMNGVWSSVTTNATTFNSGTTLTETIMNDLIQSAWDQGGEVDELYVGATLKRRISSFTAGSTRNVEATDKRLVSAVDVYESDFGIHKIFKHRHIQTASETTGRLLGIDSKRWAVAQLDAPFHEELAKTGDSTRGQLVAEITLEARNEAANFKADGLLLLA